MTVPALQPLSYPRGRLEPKLTATGLSMVAIPTNGETGRKVKVNTMEGSVTPLSSDTGLAARSLPSIVKQDTNFSS